MPTKDIFIMPLWFGKQIEKLTHDPHIYFNFIYFQFNVIEILVIFLLIKKSIFFIYYLLFRGKINKYKALENR